MQILMLPFSQW